MRNIAIVDTAALVALFDADDRSHDRAVGWFRQRRCEGHTTLAVLTEVSHMLRYNRTVQLDCLRWIRAGALCIEQLTDEDLDRCIEVMRQYNDLPADFADATLVAIAERLETRRIVTLDSDFRVYRYRNRASFHLPLLD